MTEYALISKELSGICLSYIQGSYIIHSTTGKPSKFNGLKNPQELYDNLLLVNHYDDLDNDNKLLIGSIGLKTNGDEAEEIFKGLLEDIYQLFYNTPKENLQDIITARLEAIDPKIRKRFEAQNEEFQNSKYEDLKNKIKQNLQSRSGGDVELGRRSLSEYLTRKYGVILRKNLGDIYLLDGAGYVPTNHDDLIILLTKDFGENFIHDNDLKSAIGYISDRREPVPNIVKFNNVLYDMDKLEPLEVDEPLFTLLQIDYDLKPNRKSKLFKEFLYSTFRRATESETKKAVKGVLQLSGYFFTSGNKYNVLPIATGLTGAGKSTFFNIITHIFGKDKISGVSLQELEKDSHAGSEFIESHLNIIRDSDTTMIENNSILKNWTGNEAFRVNPKYKNPVDLSAAEVPKPILVCNTLPSFKHYEDALISRFLVLEFNVSFRHKENQINDLDKLIISDKSEIEWFIYNSIKAYKEMVENNKNFIFKISDEATMELIHKHTNPLNHIITRLIDKHDPEAYDTEKSLDRLNFRPIFTDDLVDVILLYSEKSSIDVPTDKRGKINKKTLLNVIREEFDLYDGEIVLNKSTDQYDHHRDYKATNERWTTKDGVSVNKKVYPNLIARPIYCDLIKEIEANRKAH